MRKYLILLVFICLNLFSAELPVKNQGIFDMHLVFLLHPEMQNYDYSLNRFFLESEESQQEQIEKTYKEIQVNREKFKNLFLKAEELSSEEYEKLVDDIYSPLFMNEEDTTLKIDTIINEILECAEEVAQKKNLTRGFRIVDRNFERHRLARIQYEIIHRIKQIPSVWIFQVSDCRKYFDEVNRSLKENQQEDRIIREKRAMNNLSGIKDLDFYQWIFNSVSYSECEDITTAIIENMMKKYKLSSSFVSNVHMNLRKAEGEKVLDLLNNYHFFPSGKQWKNLFFENKK